MKVFFTVWFAMVFWVFAAFLAFQGTSAFAAHIVCSEQIGGESMRTMEIIEFQGHRYVHLRNHWNAAGSAFFHDPDCPCIKNAIKQIKEK